MTFRLLVALYPAISFSRSCDKATGEVQEGKISTRQRKIRNFSSVYPGVAR